MCSTEDRWCSGLDESRAVFVCRICMCVCVQCSEQILMTPLLSAGFPAPKVQVQVHEAWAMLTKARGAQEHFWQN